jgi:predicted enzyme related to lactoylglutathione lyase
VNRDHHGPRAQHPPHGQIGYLQLPAQDVARSAAFYQTVFGWSADLGHGSFEAPGMIGQ